MKLSYLFFGLLFLTGAISHASGDADPFLVIVHSANPTKEVSRRFLSDAFLKKVTYWDDGELIVPADLSPESNVRKEFSKQVLLKPVAAVKSYWQQMIFSGQGVQPVELDSGSKVIQFVSSHPGAVAYVSTGTTLTSKVKALPWR